MARGLKRAAAILIALGIMAAAVLAIGAYLYRAPGPLAETRAVIVERGRGLAGIASDLEAGGVIGNRHMFMAAAVATSRDRSLKAGEYEIPAAASLATVLEILASGRTVQHSLTIPEGLTVAEVLSLVESDDRLAGDIGTPPPEGSLLPETYSFERGTERSVLVDRMRIAMNEAVDRLWLERRHDLPFDDPHDALTLASIIEKETGVPEERTLVAGVFVNRLLRGMPLQSDPTVVYGLTSGAGPLGRPLTRADLSQDSAYNTYRNKGLPPGPIANPGVASIAAALDPAETDFLYFVADGTGGHAFATNLDDHNRNVARWRRLQIEAPAD